MVSVGREPAEPIEEAEQAINDFSDLAGGSMQAVKEKVSDAVQAGVEKVAGAWEGGKQQVQAAVGAGAQKVVSEGGENAEEEEAQREPDRDLGHMDWSQHAAHHPAAGPLHKMKEAAEHAVEGVKLRLHLGHNHQQGASGTSSTDGQPTAEERTGESMHMAKAAEGRNVKEDDPIDHALHDALKPDRAEKPELGDFPETLGDALAAAQMRDLPKDPPTAAAAAGDSAEADPVAAGGASGSTEPAPPNPFSAGARSKL